MKPEQLPEKVVYGTFGMPGTSLLSRNNYHYYVEFEIDVDNHRVSLVVLDPSDDLGDEILFRIPLSEQFLNNFLATLVEGGLLTIHQ